MDIITKAIITKDEGRRLIKNTPIELFQKISDFSRRSGTKALSCYHFEMINGLYKTAVNTQLSILSLFNDNCVFCDKPFTHYIVGKNANKQKFYMLYPVRIESDGQIVFYNIDHILPKSLGGADRLENYQLSCEDMNNRKGNILSEEDKKNGVKVKKQ